MPVPTDITSVAEIIQLAVAPVFLLAGIGALLGVLSNRLGRITDRARVLERRQPSIKDDEKMVVLHNELKSLWKRVKLINWAISLCTTGALFVCLVIVSLFIGDFIQINLNVQVVVGVLFLAAMAVIILGLICFLREIYLATGNMRIGMEFLVDTENNDHY